MDGNVKSIKVYMMVAFTGLNYTYLWFDKIDQSALIALVVPTFVAWIVAHVVQQVAKVKANGAG